MGSVQVNARTRAAACAIPGCCCGCDFSNSTNRFSVCSVHISSLGTFWDCVADAENGCSIQASLLKGHSFRTMDARGNSGPKS